MLSEFYDPATIQMAVDIISELPQAAPFYAERVSAYRLPEPVRRAFIKASEF